MYVPGIILLLMGFGVLFMNLQKKMDVEAESKMAVHKAKLQSVGFLSSPTDY
ncbi:MAG TPA: hypothetical protein VK080_12730 [Lentibacillus sp.]|nr:hypothetical protein [Lentibacillus sp.]